MIVSVCDSVVIKNDKNGNQFATVNQYEIPSDKKDSTYVDIDVTLGDNRLNGDGDQLVLELFESGKVQKRYVRGNDLVYANKGTEEIYLRARY